MQMLHERQQSMDDLGLFCRCAEEAGGVGYGMRGGECFEPRFEVGQFFGVLGCLLLWASARSQRSSKLIAITGTML